MILLFFKKKTQLFMKIHIFFCICLSQLAAWLASRLAAWLAAWLAARLAARLATRLAARLSEASQSD